MVIHMNVDNEINKNKGLLIDILSNLVSFESVLKEDDETPFGIETKKCLDYALNTCKSFGLNTKNLDDYCGYVEYGDGKEIGVVCHLDVVPAGDTWKTPPFKLTKIDDKLYGRGTSDDKGASAAMIIALKILKDNNIDLNNHKVRLIFGCNEETGSLCMKHYKEKEKPFEYGFTPDGDFPCINGEKGHITGTFKYKTSLEIEGGVVSNAVAGKVKIKVDNTKFDKEIFDKYLNDNGLTVNYLDNYIEVIGKSAHASTPDIGKNAITFAIYALNKAGYQDELINNYIKIFDLNNNGENLGINISDKFGDLTIVNGKIDTSNGYAMGTFDIRVPVSADIESIINKLHGLKIDRADKPLYYDENSFLVKRLMDAYQKVTNDYDSKPKVIGGGTYAKSFDNCVAFGCEFEKTNNIHEPNEFVKIDELLLQVKLYIEAILSLSK